MSSRRKRRGGRPHYMKRLKPPFPWQRLSLAVLGIVIIFAVWRLAVFHLYTLPPTSITVFGAITQSLMWVVGLLCAWFVTNQLIGTYNMTSAASMVQQAQQIFEDKKSTSTKEVIVKSKYLDDPTI